jgi:hypothetical protein
MSGGKMRTHGTGSTTKHAARDRQATADRAEKLEAKRARLPESAHWESAAAEDAAHDAIDAELEAVKTAVAEISRPVPTPPGFVIPDGYTLQSIGRCRSSECGERIAWARTPKGRTAPLNPDGSNHFGTCPAAESFRRRKAAEKAERDGRP